MQRFINWGALSHKTTSTSTMTLTLGAAVALMIGAGAIFTPTSAAAAGCMTWSSDDGMAQTAVILANATNLDDGLFVDDNGATFMSVGVIGDPMVEDNFVVLTATMLETAEGEGPLYDDDGAIVAMSIYDGMPGDETAINGPMTWTADLTFDDSVTGAPGQTTMNIFLAALTELPADGATETPIWTIAALSMTGTDLPLTTDVVEDAPAS